MEEKQLIKVTNHLLTKLKKYCYLIFHYMKQVFSRVDKKINIVEKIKSVKWIEIIYFCITPLLMYVIVELLNGSSIKLEKEIVKFNLLLIYLIYIGFFTIIGNFKKSNIISSIFIFLIAFLNYIVTTFRGTPLVPWDIQSANVALKVAPTFKISFTKQSVEAIIIFAIHFILLLKMKSNLLKDIKIYAVRLITFICITTFFYQFYTTDYMEKYELSSDWDPQVEYRNNGFAVSFFKQSKNLLIRQPEDYAIESVKNIAEQFNFHLLESVEEKPNIIAIMNESFADLQVISQFETNEDYMPFIHSLEENTIKGNLHMSIFGATTPNSEWEFLTGNTMAFVPNRTIPYQQYIVKKTSSMASILSDLGYNSIAMHCYYPQGYNRSVVYPLLGFKQFFHMLNMKDLNYIREYPDDYSTYQNIIELYENKKEDERIFEFIVTMQNHGSYDYEGIEETIQIQTDEDFPKLNQYLSLIKESDKAFEYLVNYFENQEEKTIIVMFGDHQPYIEDEFYQTRLAQYENVDSKEVSEKKYMTPYIIWANYPIEEKEIGDISANYLSSVIFDVANLQKTPYLEFLTQMRTEIPVITGNGYMSKDGTYHELEEINEYSEWINNYRMIQYNNMFDQSQRINWLFNLYE